MANLLPLYKALVRPHIERSLAEAFHSLNVIDGSTARRCTAMSAQDYRQSVKFLGHRRVLKNAVGVVRGSADITAK